MGSLPCELCSASPTVGTQPERHAQNPHHGEPSGRRKHDHNLKAPGAESPRSGAHDVLLILPFQASTHTIRNTTEELRNIAT
jgi:hypothetical protein